MTSEPKRKPQYVWTDETHALAVKMWGEGATAATIAEKLGVSNRVIEHHARQYRHKFPWRRSARRPRAKHKRIAFEMCAKEFKVLAEAARREKVAINSLIRNALMLARDNGYPVTDEDAMLGELLTPPPEVKPKRRFVDKTKPPKLIPYAGAPINGR